MISDIVEGHIYKSPGNNPYQVDCIAAHGQHQELQMVVYTNLSDTSGFPIGKKLVLERHVFCGLFSCYESGEYYEHNNAVPILANEGPKSWLLSLLAK